MIEDSKVRVAALEAELSALHAERPLQEITVRLCNPAVAYFW